MHNTHAQSVTPTIHKGQWVRRHLIWLSLFWMVTTAHAQQAFSFVALGDLPYGSASKAYGPYRSLIDRINQEGPAFSVHVGDFKSGSTLCMVVVEPKTSSTSSSASSSSSSSGTSERKQAETT
jgi:hypothetical protein